MFLLSQHCAHGLVKCIHKNYSGLVKDHVLALNICWGCHKPTGDVPPSCYLVLISQTWLQFPPISHRKHLVYVTRNMAGTCPKVSLTYSVVSRLLAQSPIALLKVKVVMGNLKAPTHRPDIQLPYLTILRPLRCLLSDPFGRNVALKHIALTCCLLHSSVYALAQDGISGWRLCCEL